MLHGYTHFAFKNALKYAISRLKKYKNFLKKGFSPFSDPTAAETCIWGVEKAGLENDGPGSKA